MSEPQHGGVPALLALVALGKRARDAATSAELGFVVVNETRSLLPFRDSAVWFRERGVVAVSGLPELDANTPYRLWLGALLENMALEPGQCRTFGAADVPAALAQEWSDWLAPHALLLSLARPGAAHGLWLLARDEPWHDDELALLGELAGTYGHAWQQFQPQQTVRARLRAAFHGVRRKRLIGAAALVLLLFPVRLTVLVPAEIVPKDAFLVRAPLDGVIDQLHVRPNQAVRLNDPLFDLDTTSLRTRQGVATKAYEAAAEEYRQAAQLAVSDDDKSRLDMTMRKGRMEEKAAELAYSDHLLARVQVKAPRAGVMVFGEAGEWVGKGVAVGERIMQIADPQKIEVALRLPVGDAIELEPNAALTLYLPTAARYSYAGTVTYSAYRAEPGPDGIVAYKLKADLAPGDAPPRLGLTGTAKLYGSWVPLSYWVLRRPLAALRQASGW